MLNTLEARNINKNKTYKKWCYYCNRDCNIVCNQSFKYIFLKTVNVCEVYCYTRATDVKDVV